ncbi:ubiquitin-like protein Pup [Georgenia faecalis]|uniref:Prokaryotic ubiquitin-like protein Pup n=1 Tax=Georgenia faecalis TaxID=2483799 RepID=A0ABV9D9L6_9MICO|nr:ubiquitin-like protein Pup [Georgenia faecalis]
MAQEQHRRVSREDDDAAVPAPLPPAGAAAAQARDSDLDALLADIDTVLETNAESFVRGFVQKGGQ